MKLSYKKLPHPGRAVQSTFAKTVPTVLQKHRVPLQSQRQYLHLQTELDCHFRLELSSFSYQHNAQKLQTKVHAIEKDFDQLIR